MDIGKYWKTIVDTLQDGLMVIDGPGKYIGCQPGCGTPDRILGR